MVEDDVNVIDDIDIVDVYVDGSCSPSPCGHGGAGVVLVVNNTVVYSKSFYLGVVSSSYEAELSAAKLGILLAKKHCPGHEIYVITDNCQVYNNLIRSGIYAEQVKGHRFNRFNNVADGLASMAVSSFKRNEKCLTQNQKMNNSNGITG